MKLCRRCGKDSNAVRFAPTSKRRCQECRRAEKAERIARRGTLTPATTRKFRVVGGVTKPGRVDPAHRLWIRSLPCCVSGKHGGDIVPHHVRNGTGAGTGIKPCDRWTVPLCNDHHNEGHRTGWTTFETRYGVDLRAVAERLAGISPALREQIG